MNLRYMGYNLSPLAIHAPRRPPNIMIANTQLRNQSLLSHYVFYVHKTLHTKHISASNFPPHWVFLRLSTTEMRSYPVLLGFRAATSYSSNRSLSSPPDLMCARRIERHHCHARFVVGRSVFFMYSHPHMAYPITSSATPSSGPAGPCVVQSSSRVHSRLVSAIPWALSPCLCSCLN